MASFYEDVRQAFPAKPVDIRTYSPLPLAFLGDAVYSLIARSIAVSKGNRQAWKMHDETKQLVSAHSQAAIGDAIRPLLSPEEAAIYRQGMHANPPHHAKNQSLEDYQKATALETLCGYLYLQDRLPRLLALLRAGMDMEGKERNSELTRAEVKSTETTTKENKV